jgi:hypothetical protein
MRKQLILAAGILLSLGTAVSATMAPTDSAPATAGMSTSTPISPEVRAMWQGADAPAESHTYARPL